MTMQVIPDIPKLYTALAQWLGCLMYILPMKKRLKGGRLVAALAGGLFFQCGVNYLAGLVHPFFWLGWMLTAFSGMFGLIYICCKLPIRDVGYYVIRAIIAAEFTASLEWQIYYFLISQGMKESVWISLFWLALIYAGVFCLIYFSERRHLPPNGRLHIQPRELWSAILIGVGVFLASNISFVYPNTPFSSQAVREILYIRTLVDFAGIVMLYAQLEQRREMDLRLELSVMDNILQTQYERYRMSKENDELISRKYHDLKHQIAVIRAESDPEKREVYLQEMDAAIKKHEAENRTGNGVLDSILFTKSMYCTEHKINFTCIADGKRLNFMDTMDICTIFGNALDNAIESVEKLKDPEKRLITLTVASQNNFVILKIENYYESKIKMEGGLPLTTKKDSGNHGYGIKSIRLIAEKYNGSMTVHAKDNWFSLRVLIPFQGGAETIGQRGNLWH